MPVNQQQFAFLGITANSGDCTNVRMYYVAHCTTLAVNKNCGDYDDLMAGKMYVNQFVQTLRDSKVKILRMYNWQIDSDGSTSVSQPGQDKPLTYVCYVCNEFRNSIYAGTTTNSSNAYSATFGSGSLTDKEQILVTFNATATGNPTFNLNGSGAFPILTKFGATCTSTCWPVANGYAAMVYDAGLGGWLKLHGGNASTGSNYLDNNVPPAALMELCVEVGADCWFVMPPYSLDPDQGYDTALAQLALTTLAPHGLKLYVEPPDEIWNPGRAYYTSYATAKAKANWPADNDPTIYNEEYGRWTSTIGQNVSAVFNGDASKYRVLACEFTFGVNFPVDWSNAGFASTHSRALDGLC